MAPRERDFSGASHTLNQKRFFSLSVSVLCMCTVCTVCMLCAPTPFTPPPLLLDSSFHINSFLTLYVVLFFQILPIDSITCVFYTFSLLQLLENKNTDTYSRSTALKELATVRQGSHDDDVLLLLILFYCCQRLLLLKLIQNLCYESVEVCSAFFLVQSLVVTTACVSAASSCCPQSVSRPEETLETEKREEKRRKFFPTHCLACTQHTHTSLTPLLPH